MTYPDHALDMHEEEDEDYIPLVRPTKRNEPHEEGCDQAVDDEDFALLVSSRPLETAHQQKRKGPPVWQDPTAILEQQASRDSREREEEMLIWAKSQKGDALRNIINKLLDECKLEALSPETLPHVLRAVQEEDHSFGHSRKNL